HGRRRSLLSFGDEQCDFAFDISAGFELLENFSGAPTQKFFVNLRYFARDHHVASFSKNLDHVCQGFQKPVRGFIEHLCARRIFYALEQFTALSALGGEKTTEA